MNWLTGMNVGAPRFNGLMLDWLTPAEHACLCFDITPGEPVLSLVCIDFLVGMPNSTRTACDIPDCPTDVRDWFNVGQPCDCYACYTRASDAMARGTAMIVTVDEHFWLDDDDPRYEARGLATLISDGGECHCDVCTYRNHGA